MNKTKLITCFTAMMVIFFLCSNIQAEMCRLYMDAWTTNYTDPNIKQLNVWISLVDTNNNNPPDFVQSIEVRAPDGSEFSLDPVKDWLPYDRGYWGRFFASDFVSQDFPSGTYSVTVTPKQGRKIIEHDHVFARWLNPPSVIYPTDGQTNVPATPFLQWSPVAGASYYRILLWNEDWNEPVYWYWDRQFRTDFNAVRLPLGDLKPNTNYRIRIEARNAVQDLDKRSRSDWIYFTTGSW